MWLLSLLPDSFMFFIVMFLIGIGVVGYLLGSFGGVLPMLRPYATPIKLGSIAVLCLGIYLYGGYTSEMNWREKVEALNQKVVIAEQKSKIVNTEIVTKYVDRVKVIRNTNVVVKEVIKEKNVEIDNCNIPTIVSVLNTAAKRPLNLSLPPLEPEDKE